MNGTLEQVAEEMREWIGPDFNYNCYCDAKYRISNQSVKIMDVKVPARVEAIRDNGTWAQHPVVFKRYGSYEAMKEGNAILITFLASGGYHSRPFGSFAGNNYSDAQFYQEAERLGLTKGSTSFVKSFVREEE